MLFNSFSFLFLFLPIVVILFWIARRLGSGLPILTMLCASLFFYGYWRLGFLPLLLVSTLFNFIIGQSISRARVADRISLTKWLLFVGVGGDLLLLGYYKYTILAVTTLNELAGFHFDVPAILLPIGISFFTFTQIAFLVDVYKGYASEYNPVQYGLFVSYFPHLIAGPILHHKEMIPQFRDPARFRLSAENFAIGLAIFSIGLAKKILLADSLAGPANLAFDHAANGEPITFVYAWLGTLSYTLQLYFDFSGYSDMAIGLSRIFGIALPVNFNSPYKATSIVDFWRRWHMTLSRFLREYLYIPLGGNRHGTMRRYINLFLTMLLGGLWHGAAWTFALWGGLHGVFLIVNHLWRAVAARLKGKWSIPASVRTALRRLAPVLTFLCVAIAWIPFRADGMEAVSAMLRGLSGLNGFALPERLATSIQHLVPVSQAAAIWGDDRSLERMLLRCILCLALCWFFPNTQEIMSRYWLADDGTPQSPSQHSPLRLSFSFNRRWAIACGLLLGIGIVSLGETTHFLYFQF